jgi:pimeloyl-ACP methyl ester carboxylesterase
MPQFEHDRASVNYEIVGEGKPLLLIAGLASDGASWAPLLPLLPDRQLIMIDNRASGQTTAQGSVTHGQMFDDCAALLDHLGVGPVDVAGHSLGGWIGLGLAAWHPGKVDRLVTMGTGPLNARTNILLRDLARLYFTMVPQDWFRLFYQWLFSDAFFADEANVAAAADASTNYKYRQSPGDFARQIAALDHPETVDLQAIACPVLVMAGELDLLAPADVVADFHRPIPNHQLVTITGSAHSLHWEKPVEVAAVINAFLR